jgi:hypothetical protein
VDIDRRSSRRQNDVVGHQTEWRRSRVTEHWFAVVSLVMLFLVAAMDVVALYIFYLVVRKSDRIERVTAAIYLEARKILEQHR